MDSGTPPLIEKFKSDLVAVYGPGFGERLDRYNPDKGTANDTFMLWRMLYDIGRSAVPPEILAGKTPDVQTTIGNAALQFTKAKTELEDDPSRTHLNKVPMCPDCEPYFLESLDRIEPVTRHGVQQSLGLGVKEGEVVAVRKHHGAPTMLAVRPHVILLEDLYDPDSPVEVEVSAGTLYAVLGADFEPVRTPDQTIEVLTYSDNQVPWKVELGRPTVFSLTTDDVLASGYDICYGQGSSLDHYATAIPTTSLQDLCNTTDEIAHSFDVL